MKIEISVIERAHSSAPARRTFVLNLPRLKKRPVSLAPKPLASLPTRDAAKERRTDARVAMDAEVEARVERGTDAKTSTAERNDERRRALLYTELVRLEHPPETSTKAAAMPVVEATRASTTSAHEPVSSLAAMELVEKIEAFVRSQRPALAMTLRGAMAGRVELERVGAKQVSVRLGGRRGGAVQEGALRQALGARGLTLRSFELI